MYISYTLHQMYETIHPNFAHDVNSAALYGDWKLSNLTQLEVLVKPIKKALDTLPLMPILACMNDGSLATVLLRQHRMSGNLAFG